MTIEEMIDEISLNIMGYAGYLTLEDRQDSMDVFSAWLHGRLKKKVEDMSLYAKKLSKEEEQTSKLITNRIVENLGIILNHLKYDSEKITPFMSEHFILYESVANDLVRLDRRAYEINERFCKLLEALDAVTEDDLRNALESTGELLFILRERSRRINSLNQVFFKIQHTVSEFSTHIHEMSEMDEKSFDKLFKIFDWNPKRIETYEKIMGAFKTARPIWQNYDIDKNTLFMRYKMFCLYLEHYPKLIEKAESMIESFSSHGDSDNKSLENLKKSCESPPDFEKLKERLQIKFDSFGGENALKEETNP